MVKEMDILFYIVTVLGGIIAGTIYYVTKRRRDRILVEVLEYLTDYHLDEKFFSIKKVSEGLQLPEDVVERAIVRLEKSGIVVKTSRGYALADPLVFLTPRDFERALRLTKGDNIIYGAYQMPYLTSIKYVIVQLAILIASLIFAALVFFNVLDLKAKVEGIMGVDPGMFALLVIAMAIIIVDVFNNFVKAWIRERYSVVVGFYSGILYDLKVPDELSGRVPRGAVSRIDIDINWAQKINNMFGEIPIGDVRIWVRGKKEPIVFRSMPYPRELFMVIRSLQLGALEWRKRHARELALWRGRVYPFVSYRRGRRRR